jgi:hypothetical protein
VRVANAPREKVCFANFSATTWQEEGRPSPLHPLPRVAWRGRAKRFAGFRNFGGASMTANDNAFAAARRSGSQKRQRTRNIGVPVDPSEFVLIDDKARVAGMSRASFARAAMLGAAGPRAQRAPTVNAEALAHATSALNKVGSLLNQQVRVLNSGGATITARECSAVLADVRLAVDRILEIVGRKPRL